MVEYGHPELPLTVQAALLGLSRSSLYYQPTPVAPEEVALKHRIDEIYTAHPYYGSRRITETLRREAAGDFKEGEELGFCVLAPTLVS
jgi:putative transposase